MKIIDAHLHTPLMRKDFQETAKKNNIDFSLEGLRKEMAENDVSECISLTDTFDDPTPIGFEWGLSQKETLSNMHIVCGINPYKTNAAGLLKAKQLLKARKIIGLKIYLGYYHFYPLDKVYQKVYTLAEEMNCPVIIHTGDTFSTKAMLKYSLPLTIDEVAVRFPKTKIVIAHAGYPWTKDAIEVAYKNKNVSVDISGWMFGNQINPFNKTYLQEMIEYAGSEKIIYGTDWPLVSMKTYLSFCKKAIPKKHWNNIFYKNAKEVFGI